MRKLILIFFSFSLFSQNYDYKKFSGVPYEAPDEIAVSNLDAEWKIYEKGKKDSAFYSSAGDIYSALFYEKKIPNPYAGNNEQQLQWVSERTWIFETVVYPGNFIATEKNKIVSSILKFPRLDGYASVYLNDTLILKSDNAFRTYEVEVGKIIQPGGENVLRIEFEPTEKKARELSANYPVKLPGGERVFVRKPQYQFGWDWGPKYVTCGPGRKVQFIERLQKALVVEPPTITTKQITNKSAQLKIESVVSCEEDRRVTVECYILTGENKYGGIDTVFRQSKKIKLTKEKKNISFDALIKNAQLWFPRFYGNADFYRVVFFITDDLKQKKERKFLYSITVPYGICKSELVREKDFAGESFYFRVNGKRIYARGFNYIPNDFFNPEARTGKLFAEGSTEMTDPANAYQVNCNMLRVWGGGIYEDESFYNFCLLNGIMVWQDFMYACGMYPYDEKFLANADVEAQQQTKRLQNFSNIVLWCGNNENNEGWNNWGWQKEFNYTKNDSAKIYDGNKKLFEEVIPSALKKNIPSANYVPSSPQYGWGREKSMRYGDSHYWGVWWGFQPVEKFNRKVPRFMSEFGMQALPDVACFKNFIPDSLMNFSSKEFLNHQKHPTGFKTLNHYLKNYFSIPEKTEDYSYLSQCLQAYTLNTAIEAQRRDFPYCNGTLIWQLNDCWPVCSWSVTDYNGRKKIAAYETERAFDTLLLSLKEERDRYDLYIINDSDFPLEDSLEFYISNFNGKHLYDKKIAISCNPRSSSVVFQLNDAELSSFEKNKIFALASLEKNRYRKNFHFVRPNELLLEQAQLKVTASHDKLNNYQRINADIQSNTYCPYVKISSQKYPYEIADYIPFLIPGEKTILSKNLFYGVAFPENVNLNLGKEIRCLNEFSKTK